MTETKTDTSFDYAEFIKSKNFTADELQRFRVILRDFVEVSKNSLSPDHAMPDIAAALAKGQFKIG